jgi:hypothetical protein
MTSIERVRWVALAGFGVMVLAVGMMGAGLAGAEEGEVVQAEANERGPCCRGGRGMASMAEELDLSEAQQALFDEVQALTGEQREARRSQRRGGRFGDLVGDEADAETLHADIDARFDEARELAHASVDARIAFHDSLDEDQLEMLAERGQQRGSRMRGECEGDRCRRGSSERGARRGRCARGDRSDAPVE